MNIKNLWQYIRSALRGNWNEEGFADDPIFVLPTAVVPSPKEDNPKAIIKSTCKPEPREVVLPICYYARHNIWCSKCNKPVDAVASTGSRSKKLVRVTCHGEITDMIFVKKLVPDNPPRIWVFEDSQTFPLPETPKSLTLAIASSQTTKTP